MTRPTLAIAFFLFPEYYPRIIEGGPVVTIPTTRNGGLRPLPTKLGLWLFHRDRLREIQALEAAIIPLEQTVHRAALDEAFRGLLRFMHGNENLATLHFRGIASLTDDVVDGLSRESRRFFRTYFSTLFDQGMNRVLELIVADGGSPERAILTPEMAQRIVADVAADGALFEKARIEAGRRIPTPSAFIQGIHHTIIKIMDPAHNRQVQRIQSVNRQRVKPPAMARAVRGMVASYAVDKPIELVFLFLLMAAAEDDLLQPIQDEFSGENSFFYLSKYVFGYGFLSGIILGLMADTWMKLQQDERLDTEFGNVPTGKDAEGSFARWYFKQTFRNPKNTLWQNQLHYIKLIWANMRAAAVTMIVLGLLTMGRFDLDRYVNLYLFAYFTPLDGFAFKLEQGYELASYYVAKDIPAHLRAHPIVQKYISDNIMSKRIMFNLWYKIYEDVLGCVLNHFQLGATPQFGKRSLLRVIFGGFTPTEAVGTTLHAAGERLAWLPGARTLFEACETLVTHNYTAWQGRKPPHH